MEFWPAVYFTLFIAFCRLLDFSRNAMCTRKKVTVCCGECKKLKFYKCKEIMYKDAVLLKCHTKLH